MIYNEYINNGKELAFSLFTEAVDMDKVEKAVNDIAEKLHSPIRFKDITTVYRDTKEELHEKASHKIEGWLQGYCDNLTVYLVKEENYNTDITPYYPFLLHEYTHALLNGMKKKCNEYMEEGITAYMSGQYPRYKDKIKKEYADAAKEVEEIVKKYGYAGLYKVITGKDYIDIEESYKDLL